MAEKLFNASTQSHNCQREVAGLPGDHHHGDVAQCSCGEFFTWMSGQRDSYWKKVTEEEAIAIVANANPTLSGFDIENILHKF